jgi:hypothetical protein
MNSNGRHFLKFVSMFLILFVVLNYGTFYFIGLTVPGGYYSYFLDRYADYPEGLLKSLLWGSQHMLSLFGFKTHVQRGDLLYLDNGRGIQLAYDCLGYGVLSFWAAYVLANSVSAVKKIGWLLGGSFILWVINVSRISLFLVAVNKKWQMPFGIGQHDWFNIVSYFFIFLLIWFFERKLSHQSKATDLDANSKAIY